MEDLEKLILFLQNEFKNFYSDWKNDGNYVKFNMKKNLVENLYNDENLFLYVLKYRDFISSKVDDMHDKVNNLGIENVTFRIKTVNSIQYKIKNYTKTHEYGKIPINKCLNDLLGFRIICPKNINFDSIFQIVEEKFDNIKCISGSKGEYVAVHLYFGKGNNYVFPWELQIWDKSHEESNYSSHFKYKQSYTKWEKENEEDI